MYDIDKYFLLALWAKQRKFNKNGIDIYPGSCFGPTSRAMDPEGFCGSIWHYYFSDLSLALRSTSGSFTYDHFQFCHINAVFLPAFGIIQWELDQYGIRVYFCLGLVTANWAGKSIGKQLDCYSQIPSLPFSHHHGTFKERPLWNYRDLSLCTNGGHSGGNTLWPARYVAQV